MSLGGQSAIRLRNNARGLRQYADNFSRRRFDVLPDLRMELVHGDVRITVVPDLHVSERGKEKILKLDFASRTPDAQVIRIVSQCMFEASKKYSWQNYIIVCSISGGCDGTEHRGARIGARLLGDVRAACDKYKRIVGNDYAVTQTQLCESLIVILTVDKTTDLWTVSALNGIYSCSQTNVLKGIIITISGEVWLVRRVDCPTRICQCPDWTRALLPVFP